MSDKPKRKWFLRGWAKAIFCHGLNAFFWFFKKRGKELPKSPRRILVCNVASFGDVVISTTVFPVLKKHYPGCEIGFLSSSKTKEVLQNHPLVSFVHTIEHWFWNEEEGRIQAFVSYLRDFLRVVREIRKERYELAIDLYPHFFLTVIPLLWKAKIPFRIGRFTPGFSNLLTHIGDPPLSTDYMGKTHLKLLRVLGFDIEKETPLPSYVAQNSPKDLPVKNYVVVHMGTGYFLKEWDTEKWVQLVRQLKAKGERVVLTGKGGREKVRSDQVAAKTGCENYCDRLSWREFTSVVQNAKLLISVDSASIHLASAVSLPCIVLFAGISSIAVWKPPYAECKAVMKKLPCSPCLIRSGCSAMSCIQGIGVGEVIDSLPLFLKNSLLNRGIQARFSSSN